MRMGLDGLSVMDFFSVSKIARDYPVNELFRTQWKQEPSTQSRSPLPVHSILPILHQRALHALACLSGPNAQTARRGGAHRDRCLSRHPGFATETGFLCMPILARSGVPENG